MNHGTRGCYLTYKCRCDSCVLAAKIYRNEQRLRTGKVLKSRPRLNGTTIVCKFCKNEFAYTRSRNKHCPDCIKNHKVRRKTWDDDVSKEKAETLENKKQAVALIPQENSGNMSQKRKKLKEAESNKSNINIRQ